MARAVVAAPRTVRRIPRPARHGADSGLQPQKLMWIMPATVAGWRRQAAASEHTGLFGRAWRGPMAGGDPSTVGHCRVRPVPDAHCTFGGIAIQAVSGPVVR